MFVTFLFCSRVDYMDNSTWWCCCDWVVGSWRSAQVNGCSGPSSVILWSCWPSTVLLVYYCWFIACMIRSISDLSTDRQNLTGLFGKCCWCWCGWCCCCTQISSFVYPRAGQPCTCVLVDLNLKKYLHGIIPHLQSPSHFLSRKRKSDRNKTHFVCLLCSDVHLAYLVETNLEPLKWWIW